MRSAISPFGCRTSIWSGASGISWKWSLPVRSSIRKLRNQYVRPLPPRVGYPQPSSEVYPKSLVLSFSFPCNDDQRLYRTYIYTFVLGSLWSTQRFLVSAGIRIDQVVCLCQWRPAPFDLYQSQIESLLFEGGVVHCFEFESCFRSLYHSFIYSKKFQQYTFLDFVARSRFKLEILISD